MAQDQELLRQPAQTSLDSDTFTKEEKRLIAAAGIAALAVIAALFLFIALMSALYSVDQREYALQLRFGEVKEVRTSPGLYIKAPFIDSVQRIDRRTLRADIPPRQVPDQDKERLIIDTVIRYQITDPLAFRQTLRNEATAYERLQTIIYSAMRDTIAQHDRTDVIGARPKLDEQGNLVNNEQGLPIYESLVGTRDAISKAIHQRVYQAVTGQGYGITIISADIKRADFPPEVRSSIIERLWAERQRVAARHRADGEEEYRKRTAAVQAEADILIAEAKRDARKTRGEGDAQAIALVQEALELDPGFYNYLRTLESYQDSIQTGATLVLTDTPGGYLEILSAPPSQEQAPQRRGKNRSTPMQDKYTADAGDFGKYGLLRALTGHPRQKDCLKLGVVWYLTEEKSKGKDGKHTTYLRPTKKNARDFRACDPCLYDKLAHIIKSGNRSVTAVQEAGIFPQDTSYHQQLLSMEGIKPIRGATSHEQRELRRTLWHQEALKATEGCDLVLLDPDNGLKKDPGNYPKQTLKHAFYQELGQYLNRGQGLVVYHHLNRTSSARNQTRHLHLELYQTLGHRAFAMLYHRGSARIFLVIPAAGQRETLYDRASKMLKGPWAKHFDMIR